MNSAEYQELALRTESPITPELIERLTGNARAVHAFFGLLTETGELADGFKRAIFYGKPLDTTNINEEVGDVLWYLAILIDVLGIDFESCMIANIKKLRKRYPNKYSHESALNRDLEAEREAIAFLATSPKTLIGPKPEDETLVTEHSGGVNDWSRPLHEDPKPEQSSVVVKKPLGHSYTRYCSMCNIQPIHKTNSIGICTPCYMKHGEPKSETSLADHLIDSFSKAIENEPKGNKS